MIHSFGFTALVLTSSRPVKMRLKCEEQFHGYLTPPHDLQKNAA